MYMLVQTHLVFFRLLTAAFSTDILLERILMRFVHQATDSERDEGWRLFHYQPRGYSHRPVWIEQSREALNLGSCRYRRLTLIVPGQTEQMITGIMHTTIGRGHNVLCITNYGTQKSDCAVSHCSHQYRSGLNSMNDWRAVNMIFKKAWIVSFLLYPVKSICLLDGWVRYCN